MDRAGRVSMLRIGAGGGGGELPVSTKGKARSIGSCPSLPGGGRRANPQRQSSTVAGEPGVAHLLSCRAPPRRIELMRAEARERMIEPLERGAHERRDIRGESPAILGPNRAVEIVIHEDRKSGVSGKSVSVSGDLGGRRTI